MSEKSSTSVKENVDSSPPTRTMTTYKGDLRGAAASGDLEVVKHVVEKLGADVHEYKDNALRGAAYNGYLNVVKYLVEEAGADVHVGTYNTESDTLIEAAHGGQLKIVEYLLDNTDSNINAIDQNIMRNISSEGRDGNLL